MGFTAFNRFQALSDAGFGEAAQPRAEEQNGDYESGVVQVESEWWRLRTARVTPKKPGAFVAVWTRDENGETRPFGSEDQAAGLLVFVQDADRFGVFRFTDAHLEALGVTRSAAHAGKRGFRVYPAWSVDLNRQATRTQAEQAAAFMPLS
ncbi:MepB family protein [Microterricola viridarii]|uniref:Metallopeptidase n=1 Tax=Microterricola viridarii TaxID=412690 RepID=A0A109QYC7_9MICO|nr:MepB family protein [Microterricola viridarii]AMB58170.1 metallopeptidase [Microterricola viridarii]